MFDPTDRIYVTSQCPEAIDPSRSSVWEVLSNELTNSLAPIVSAVDRLRCSGASEAQLNERWCDLVHAHTAQIVQLASDMLDMGRAFKGTLRIERGEWDLAWLLERASSACAPHLYALGQALTVESPPGRVSICGDGGRLVSALKALLLRAARIMHEDPIQLVVRCIDTEVEMRVGDLDDTDEWMSESPDVSSDPLGFGLALARHVIELHGGSLAVGRSQFTIRLPLSRSALTRKQSLLRLTM